MSEFAFGTVDTIRGVSKITGVTVFFRRAQVTRRVWLNLVKGKHTVLPDHLPRDDYPQSVQVEGIAGCFLQPD